MNRSNHSLIRWPRWPGVTPLLLAFALLWPPSAGAAGQREASAHPLSESSTGDGGESVKGLSPSELDRTIGEVIQQRKYSWRMPREAAPDEPAKSNFLTEFLEKAGSMIRDAIRSFFDWLGRVLSRLFRGFRPSGSLPSSNLDWAMLSQVLLYLLVAVVLSALAILVYRLWRNRQPKAETLQAEAIQVVPDVADESVGAQQLPEDGWTRLAGELLARGEFRLALRAFYLASLAHLAERNLISLARFKSNADYRRELARRAHSFPVLLDTFGDNVRVFDRVWYGTHGADGELVAQFASNVDRIKAGA